MALPGRFRRVSLAPTLRAAALTACAAMLAAGPASVPAARADEAWRRNERVAVRLVSAATATGGRDTVWLALEFRLAPGWKTYWRSPGEAGIPAQLDWSGSENARPEPHWPAPGRFVLAGLESVGYGGRVVVPIAVRIAAPGAPARVRLHLRFAACREVCVPEEAHFDLALSGGPARPTAHAGMVAAARRLVPGDGARHGWRVVSYAREGKAMVVVVASAGAPFRAPDLFCEGAPGDGFGRPRVTLSEGGRRATFTVPIVAWASSGDRRYRMTLVDGARTAEFAAGISY
jgi:suppressor for copper-sensitivity B